ncbi:MAG TPA: nucleoside 2-deoxyribosyltransferase [Rhodoblastus sp.]|nr:nucleoside 2-deoxyribosyltransferase [Rhodoblastus sp.]
MQTAAKRIYLAGPLGFSELGRLGLDAIVALARALGHDVVDPFALTPPAEIDRIARLPSLDAQRDAWRDLNQRIGAANARAIDSCDLVLAVMDGADVDSGTAAEIGYAFARGKMILGYRGDFRLASDNLGSTVNLQVEYFIRAGGGEIVTTLAALRARLAAP